MEKCCKFLYYMILFIQINFIQIDFNKIDLNKKITKEKCNVYRTDKRTEYIKTNLR